MGDQDLQIPTPQSLQQAIPSKVSTMQIKLY